MTTRAKYDGHGFRLDSRHLRPTWANHLGSPGEPKWWFYEDEKGIDIYHVTKDGVQSAAIPKRWLLEYARAALLKQEND